MEHKAVKQSCVLWLCDYVKIDCNKMYRKYLNNLTIDYNLIVKYSSMMCSPTGYLRTWFVQTITGCWLFSMLSLTCRTQCTHSQSPERLCSLSSRIHDLSCSDCVTVTHKHVRAIITVLVMSHYFVVYSDHLFGFYTKFFSHWPEDGIKSETARQNKRLSNGDIISKL